MRKSSYCSVVSCVRALRISATFSFTSPQAHTHLSCAFNLSSTASISSNISSAFIQLSIMNYLPLSLMKPYTAATRSNTNKASPKCILVFCHHVSGFSTYSVTG